MMTEETVANLLNNKKIFVTGGLGSIGLEIVRQLLHFNPKLVRVMDNRETEQFYSRQIFESNPEVQFMFGDVRDSERLDEAIEGIDIVFHAAAMKHVIICENDPVEAIKTNVTGTQNVISSALHNDIERLILISTDKAVNPTNVMGATKLLAERLISASCNIRSNKNTKFGVVRFGNVLSSRGSVLEIWDKQLSEGKKISITNPDMTRFFMSIPRSVRLVFLATFYADIGETFILKMPSIRIMNLAEAFLVSRGYPKDFYEITGTRPGEKMHEGLLFEDETGFLMENEELLVRLPLSLDIDSDVQRFEKLGFKKSTLSGYSSKEERFLLNDDIQTLIGMINGT